VKTTAQLAMETIPISGELRAGLEQEIRNCGESLYSGPMKRPPLPALLGRLGCATLFCGGISYLLSLVHRSLAFSALILTGLVVIVGLGTVLGLIPRRAFKVRRYLKSVIRRNESLLKDGRVVSIRCKPLAVIQVNHKLEGVHHYIFDVGESTLLYLGCCGSDYQQLFPSHDFELLGYVDSNTVWSEVSHASGLEPVRVIEQEVSRRFRVPDGVMFTFRGTLDSVEQDLRNRLPLRRSDESLWYC